MSREDDRRQRTFERLYSSFEMRPIDPALEAAWRLGGPVPPGVGHVRLFSYQVGFQYPYGGSRTATEADTNLESVQLRFEEFVIESWMLRLSKAIDDPLRAFFGSCAVHLTMSRDSSRVTTPLIDLLDRVSLVGGERTTPRKLYKYDDFRVEVRVPPEAQLAYSSHLSKMDPPVLKVWLYLEGTAVHEVYR